MEHESFFHLFANGSDARNFIICKSDFYVAFNLIGVCAANTNVRVVSFSIEETHPHILLYGSKSECNKFKNMYVQSVLHHITATRGTGDDVRLNCDLYPVTDEDYLMNVAVYTIVQPTKDGKRIMPYDYLWGTASMYFRTHPYLPIWLINMDGTSSVPVQVGSLTARQRISLLSSRKKVPDDWLVCNGFLLPSNYVDVDRFETIYETPNCFRVFMGNSKRKDEVVLNRMQKVHGANLDDLEARRICENVCWSLFEKRTARWLDVEQRVKVATVLRKEYKMSYRQIAVMSRLPEDEVRKYVK